ncbi:unnamed protein product [Cuscuta campestris]|uniref:Methyltransferase n=1 Tax=Cuscuta campestris TaxID=132261 RepID=A0A484NIR0_9ASTE|nr:unnamed protein product [Cuscuta campestris]
MALGKYSRIDDKKSSSSHCSTATIVVLVALCLVGVWMMTSLSIVPTDDVSSQERNSEPMTQVSERNENSSTDEGKPKPFDDNPGNLPVGATDKDTAVQDEKVTGSQDATTTGENQVEIDDKSVVEEKKEEPKFEGEPKGVLDNVEEKKENEELKGEDKEFEVGEKTEPKSFGNDAEIKPEETPTDIKNSGDKENGKAEEKVDDTKDQETSGVNLNNISPVQSPLPSDVSKTTNAFGDKEKVEPDMTEDNKDHEGSGEIKDKVNDVFPSAAQAELLNETSTHNGAFSTQAIESKNEKIAEKSFEPEKGKGYSWKLCNVTAGPDYIPCLDNLEAIKHLKSTMHYEHRERHCPVDPPTCLVPLPEGYQRPIKWPTSREKIWYHNVPHTKLAEYKGHQNWVKANGEYLTFPGGGTQFVHGALHYIDFIQQSVRDITWGKRTRVVLDVGCGVASFGGYLFDRDVLTMSFAPKDEHEAQVQFALERGIPAISAVMGTKRLPFPSRVFDVVHCARCRVPWHIEGGKLLLELNRLLRPGGFFVWSATPVYRKNPEDAGIWEAMKNLTKSMCWDLVSITKDKVNKVGIAIYRKPTSNDCYEQRSQGDPPLCQESDDPDASWNVPLQACMHRVPTAPLDWGSQWPELWPSRLAKSPYWLQSSQIGVYGKPAPEDFDVDYQHWKRVISKTYLNGMGIDWSIVRNVMDMRAIYGG